METKTESYQELQGAKENTTETAKCPSCGAELVYFPEKKCLKCPYCGTEKDIDLSKYGEELEFNNLLSENNSWAHETHVYRCNNCGAKEVLSKNEIATICPFCGTTNIVETDELSGIKPNAVVPFAFSVEIANQRILAWAKKKIYAPKEFKKSIKAEDLRGTYNPSFTFDTDTFSSYYGELGKYYYKTEYVNGKSVQSRELRYFDIQGTYGLRFDDILIQASQQISQKTLDSLQPFYTNQSHEYSTEFLHGYTAQQYSKDGAACWKEARSMIDASVRRRILGKYNYDTIRSLHIDVSCTKITYKYVLIPIYIGLFTWKNKKYNFFINGINGKITGKTPISMLKVSVTLIVILAIFIIIAIIAFNF